MSFFKLLSDKQEDFEPDDRSYCDEDEDPYCTDFYNIKAGELENFLEVTLDTGEQFFVPLEWLIAACRYHRFSSDTAHSGFMH